MKGIEPGRVYRTEYGAAQMRLFAVDRRSRRQYTPENQAQTPNKQVFVLSRKKLWSKAAPWDANGRSLVEQGIV